MSDAIDRELAAVIAYAGGPREPRLGCSTIAHDSLGYCAGCTAGENTPSGWAVEANGWRLLALREPS